MIIFSVSLFVPACISIKPDSRVCLCMYVMVFLTVDIGPDQEGLDWCGRMKLALGAAKGLEYLHDKAEPPIIYGNMKSTNILLESDLNPKLSDFGMANIGPYNDKFHGYSAPEYTGTNNMTQKSDVYSFGVVLLELISGRRAIDATKPLNEQNLVSWVISLCISLHEIDSTFKYVMGWD